MHTNKIFSKNKTLNRHFIGLTFQFKCILIKFIECLVKATLTRERGEIIRLNELVNQI